PDPPLGAIPRMGMTPALLRLGGAPPARLEALGTVVRGWVAESNGRLEVAVFELDPPLAEREVSSSLFAQLELHCLDTAAAIEARRAPAARAFAILFTCAAQGGAYGGARHGAYGRLDAWRSLAGFVGAGADAPLAELERHAVAAAWYDFGGATSWFHGSVWDLGLAALAPGGGSLAVLAATDVD
ncbi:MAG: DUF6183 family protein, partial [Armatimonadota bacterium]|nr:DUF6183 family protein [Armatimonadota bacterium]